uniref:Peptidase_M1_N domain-containing protein n=1 Tax=Ascaris lumbricoides TaxID=6252 RepID=A0A0M3HQC8_ASCLU
MVSCIGRMAQQAIINAQLCTVTVFTAIYACLAYSTVDLFDSYFRLPQHFNPIIYDLKLTLSPKKETIWGQVRIEMQCTKPTSEVLLHANPLFVKVQHATIENRLTNETIDLGIPNVDWNRYLIVFNSNTVFDSGSVYYLSVWYQTTYADSHGGLIKYEDKVWRILQILFSSFNIRLINFCLII